MKKSGFLIVLLVLSIPLFCQEYKLTISTYCDQHFSVDPSGPVCIQTINGMEYGDNVYGHGEFYFLPGDIVTLVGVSTTNGWKPAPCPKTGMIFLYWTGDVSSSDETITIVMDEDKDITAIFHDNEHIYPYGEYNDDPCSYSDFVHLSLEQSDMTVNTTDPLNINIYGNSLEFPYNFSALFTYDPTLLTLDTTKDNQGFTYISPKSSAFMKGELIEPGKILLSGHIDFFYLDFQIFLKAIAPGQTTLGLSSTEAAPIIINRSKAQITIIGEVPINKTLETCYIPFSDQKGSIASDLIDDGEPNDANLINGIQWSSDREGSIKFTQIDSSANMGYGTFGIEKTNEFSLLFSLKIEQTMNQTLHYIIRRGLFGYPFLIRVEPSRKIFFGCRTDKMHYLHSSERLEFGTWYNIAATYKEGEQALYINGRKIAVAEVHGTINLCNIFQNTYLGSIYGMSSDSLLGGLDELKIYNQALTDEEISYLQEK